MNTKVDMNYRFVWDNEPTDEQLQAIMQEVGEDVRYQQKKTQQTILENIKKAAAQARKKYYQTTSL